MVVKNSKLTHFFFFSVRLMAHDRLVLIISWKAYNALTVWECSGVLLIKHVL